MLLQGTNKNKIWEKLRNRRGVHKLESVSFLKAVCCVDVVYWVEKWLTWVRILFRITCSDTLQCLQRRIAKLSSSWSGTAAKLGGGRTFWVAEMPERHFLRHHWMKIPLFHSGSCVHRPELRLDLELESKTSCTKESRVTSRG